MSSGASIAARASNPMASPFRLASKLIPVREVVERKENLVVKFIDNRQAGALQKTAELRVAP